MFCILSPSVSRPAFVIATGFSRVVLNPAAYIIPKTSPKIFLIADDQDAADAARDYGYTEEELREMVCI
jgi:hypothetical protein